MPSTKHEMPLDLLRHHPEMAATLLEISGVDTPDHDQAAMGLARFGVEHVESALVASGRSLVVHDDSEGEDDLVRDVTEVRTSMCARLYGRRSARRRAQAAMDAARNAKEGPA